MCFIFYVGNLKFAQQNFVLKLLNPKLIGFWINSDLCHKVVSHIHTNIICVTQNSFFPVYKKPVYWQQNLSTGVVIRII